MDALLIASISIGTIAIFMLGVPILLVIGLWVVGISLVIDFTLANIGVTLYEGLNFFGLLAMPLFVLTGDLINASGIARRLSHFAYSSLGWLHGGLAMAALGACGLFAAISGSNAATTATIGSIMHPEMVKGKYDEAFSAATVAAGGTVGIIIPPSILFIVYGFLMNIPISDLFLAGLLPGLLMVIAMQVTCYIVSRKNRWGEIIPFVPKNVAKAALGAYLGFFAIFLILYGIYTGKFSPTEASGITVGFCLLSGLFITREIKLKELPEIIFRSGKITGVLAPLVAVSIVMQQILSLLGAKEVLTNLLLASGGYFTVLAISMALVFICGCILESVPLTIILAPILAPIVVSMGMDPVQFAVVFLVGGAIGFITPPYGLNLYVASSITGIAYTRLLPNIVPYLGALLLVWFLTSLIPWLTMAFI